MVRSASLWKNRGNEIDRRSLIAQLARPKSRGSSASLTGLDFVHVDFATAGLATPPIDDFVSFASGMYCSGFNHRFHRLRTAQERAGAVVRILRLFGRRVLYFYWNPTGFFHRYSQNELGYLATFLTRALEGDRTYHAVLIWMKDVVDKAQLDPPRKDLFFENFTGAIECERRLRAVIGD